ncbi:MAG: ABC transporter permease [Treponema sp.]|jgi:ribose/xylose/arabinose/galactoside ABC-type transport system permease subunit|nr:ABC transporter permease [Treponema sp.]
MVKNTKVSILRSQHALLGFVIIFIALVISLINSRFIAVTNLLSIFQQISVLGILTMTMSILLISGGIDLSIGNSMVLSGMVMGILVNEGVSVSLAACVGVFIGGLCGLVNGLIVSYSRCIPLIITLGTGQIFHGITLTLSGGRIISFKGTLDYIGKTRIFGVFPIMLFALIIVIAVTWFMMNYTKYGRRIVAIGANEQNAYLSGIKVLPYKISLYTIGGLFCGVAAIIFSARLDSITSSAVNAGYETRTLSAAIIGGVTFTGGKGTISGAFLGCLLMGVINNAMNILKVPSYIQTIISGAIIVTAVVVSNINNIKRKA